MARKIDPVGRPAGGARAVQPQHTERHWQAAPALDHVDQIGIGEIVVGLGIAAIPVPLRNDRRKRREAPRRRLARSGGRRYDVARQLREVRGSRAPIRAGRIDSRQQQRRLPDVDLRIGQRARRLQRRARLDHRMTRICGRPTPSPSPGAERVGVSRRGCTGVGVMGSALAVDVPANPPTSPRPSPPPGAERELGVAGGLEPRHRRTGARVSPRPPYRARRGRHPGRGTRRSWPPSRPFAPPPRADPG